MLISPVLSSLLWWSILFMTKYYMYCYISNLIFNLFPKIQSLLMRNRLLLVSHRYLKLNMNLKLHSSNPPTFPSTLFEFIPGPRNWPNFLLYPFSARQMVKVSVGPTPSKNVSKSSKRLSFHSTCLPIRWCYLMTWINQHLPTSLPRFYLVLCSTINITSPVNFLSNG